MAFDIAVGVSTGQLNSASSVIYSTLYPSVFTGSGSSSYQGVDYTVSWDVKTAPTFDLGTAAPAGALVESAVARARALGRDEEEARAIVTGLAASLPSFTLHAAQVDIGLQADGQLEPTTLSLPLTAACVIQVSGSQVSFVVTQVTAPSQGSGVEDHLISTIVCPAIQSALTSVLSGLTIPPPQVGGLQLSSPSLGIVNGQVIATLNLAGNGPPSPPDAATPWPAGQNLFVLLGPSPIQAELQAALAQASNNFSDSGSGGDSWAGYNWSYGMRLTSPSVSLSDGLSASFGVAGSVSAGVVVVWVPIGLDFNAEAAPDPSVDLSVSVSGAQVSLATQAVSDFAILVTPGGSIPDVVAGWLVSAIVTGIASSLEPLIAGFLGGISVTSFSIPPVSVSVSGRTLNFTPTGLSVVGIPDYLGVTGALAVSG